MFPIITVIYHGCHDHCFHAIGTVSLTLSLFWIFFLSFISIWHKQRSHTVCVNAESHFDVVRAEALAHQGL